MPRYIVYKETLEVAVTEAPTEKEAIQVVDEDYMEVSTVSWWAYKEEE